MDEREIIIGNCIKGTSVHFPCVNKIFTNDNGLDSSVLCSTLEVSYNSIKIIVYREIHNRYFIPIVNQCPLNVINSIGTDFHLKARLNSRDSITSFNISHVSIPAAEDDPEDDPLPERMEVHYDVEGSARKALAHAIGEGIGAYPSYKAAPSFTYIIGDYTLDRHGVLTGPHNAYLLRLLAQDGYQTK